MASRRMMIVLLLVFIVATAGNFLVTTSAASSALDIVCNKALDEAFCFSHFGSARTANILQLARIVIDKASVDAAAAKAKALSLFQSAKDPQLKADLQQCGSFYIDAVNAIRLAPTDISKQNYQDLSLHAGMVSDAGVNCEASFKAPLESPLTAQNRDLKLLGNILGVISNELNK